MVDKVVQAVEQAFAETELEPRPGQADLCCAVVASLLSKPVVFLDAPTGSGKSVVAVVTARALAKLDPELAMGVVVSSTNSLVKQYERDFGFKHGVVSLFGADRYECGVRTALEHRKVTAARCYRKSKFFFELDEGTVGPCYNCDFKKSREGKATDALVVTNYSYFFVDRLYLETLADSVTFRTRGFYAFDEAHLFNDQFSNHCSVFFSRARADEFLGDAKLVLNEGAVHAYTEGFKVILENAARSTIGPANAKKFLSTLMKFYGTMFASLLNLMRSSGSEVEHDEYAQMGEKYRNMLCKIEDYFRYDYEVAVDCDEDNASFAVKPVFALGTFEALRGRRNLFMSATLDPEFLSETLRIDEKDVASLRAPYPFLPDDKSVVFPHKPVYLNYKTVKDPKVVGRLAHLASEALKRHPNESGIVVSTSFALGDEVARRGSFPHHDLIVHRRGQRVEDYVELLKKVKRPSVLFSPSLFEGIDLPGEASRFQVLLKAPYYSLGDKRVTLIMRKYPGAYEKMTVTRLVQGLGRSTRYSGDKSTSYMLDENLVKVFDSKHNRWREQFSVTKGWDP